MSKYAASPAYSHNQKELIGILLINLGTPEAPDKKSLRRYLAEFLADPRVVEIPRFLWRLILHLVILRIRPGRSARAYQKIWTAQGSPLLVNSTQLVSAIQNSLGKNQTMVELAMRYGQPSVARVLKSLRDAGMTKLLVLPLYPQYSATTTASCFDAVSQELCNWRRLPDIRFISHYHDLPAYIQALSDSIRNSWQQRGQAEKILFSFHGIPQRYFAAGDPYFCECQKTARLVAESLSLTEEQWQVSFQSRFGREPWLQPYTDKTLEQLAAGGIKKVDVICPGFACDCLETLEEIAVENRDIFIAAGGEHFNYIPALNSQSQHVQALVELLIENMSGWEIEASREKTVQRAKSMGAEI